MNGDITLRARYEAVLARISDACRAAGRPPGSVRLLAVSKTFGADDIRGLAALGQAAFGENYLQEALSKMEALSDQTGYGQADATATAAGLASGGAATGGAATGGAATGGPASGGLAPAGLAPAGSPPVCLEWHFIGPIQSNKTRPVAEHFQWVHGVEREKIAVRLSDQRPAHLPPLQLCVQVNVSGEASKSGCDPREALALARVISTLPRVRLRGVMSIPAPTDDAALQREQFARVRSVFEEIQAAGLPVDTLSMGMSDDLEAAIAEGSTMVRVGTALFGRRVYVQQA